MASEQELKKNNPLHKEFQNLLDQDFKDRKLKENEIIKATVTEITKNFVVVDCKAKMEGMIPVEEFKRLGTDRHVLQCFAVNKCLENIYF